MIDRAVIAAQLEFALLETNWPELGQLYRGKVRDVYRRPGQMLIVTSDRVSAFDHVLGTIPFKGEILNAIAVHHFEATRDIIKNHLIGVPDPNVLLTREMTPFPIEFVVRGYLTGSLWKDYQSGTAGGYGIAFPSGLRKDQRFTGGPILTPSTKEEIGHHDQPVSKAEIVARGMMSAAALEEAEAIALRLFSRGSVEASKRGLILVDTKYELGTDADGKLVLIDEIHTPDSSRYWVAAGSVERFERGEAQEMLDKQNLRQWLIEKHAFSGQGTPPALDAEIRILVAAKYIELYERLLGKPFIATPRPIEPRIRANLARAGLI